MFMELVEIAALKILAHGLVISGSVILYLVTKHKIQGRDTVLYVIGSIICYSAGMYMLITMPDWPIKTILLILMGVSYLVVFGLSVWNLIDAQKDKT